VSRVGKEARKPDTSDASVEPSLLAIFPLYTHDYQSLTEDIDPVVSTIEDYRAE
jgi:hypothetical protein